MSDKPTIPAPQYTILQALQVCLAMARRALEEVRALARIPGPQGEPGPPGKGLKGDKGDAGERGIEGKAGPVGPAGRDGFGFEDFDVVYDGKRTFTFRWSRGDDKAERTFRVPVVLDAGVWKGGQHEAGDQVTHQGHTWIAKRDTDKQPDTAPEDWRMAMRKPRDGRDGKPGDRGGAGPKGEKGDPGPRGY